MTNDFSLVGELVSETRKLLDSVSGNLATRFARTDTKTILVGGVWEKFYPVYFPAPEAGRLNHLQVYRSNPIADRGGIKRENGSVGLDFVGTSTLALKFVACAQRANPYTEVTCNMSSSSSYPMVGRIQNNTLLNGLIVWLRGGNVSYEFNQDSMMPDMGIFNERKYFERLPSSGLIPVEAGVYLAGLNVENRDIDPIRDVHLTAKPKPDGDGEWSNFS